MEIDINDLNKVNINQIIDLRDKEKFLRNHFNNAINVSLNYLLIYPERYLDKKKKYLLVCDYGISSKKTSDILNKLGYTTYSLKNGVSRF